MIFRLDLIKDNRSLDLEICQETHQINDAGIKVYSFNIYREPHYDYMMLLFLSKMTLISKTTSKF